MTAAPAARIVAVSAPNPPSTTTAGNGPVPLGNCTLAEKLELRPAFVTFTVMLVLDTVPVTLCGRGGFSPYTNFSDSLLISSRRQRQSDLLVIPGLSSLRNGSGSLALVGKELTSGRVGTAQSAPSSSTLAATAA